MTEERQRIAIAEFCGAVWHEVPPMSGWVLTLTEDERKGFERLHPKRILSFHDWPFDSPRCAPLPFPNPETGDAISVPDYPRDLNAMHEAKKLLTEDQIPVYWQTLYEVCKTTQWPFNPEAYQEAETFLRTIGKWESL